MHDKCSAFKGKNFCGTVPPYVSKLSCAGQETSIESCSFEEGDDVFCAPEVRPSGALNVEPACVYIPGERHCKLRGRRRYPGVVGKNAGSINMKCPTTDVSRLRPCPPRHMLESFKDVSRPKVNRIHAGMTYTHIYIYIYTHTHT